MTEEVLAGGIADHPNIHMAILSAGIELPAISRNGEMTLGSNTISFTRIEDIRHALYPVLNRHGLVIYPQFVTKSEVVHQAESPWTAAQVEPATLGKDEQDRPIHNPTAGRIIPEGRPIRDGRIPSTRFDVTVVYDFVIVYAPTGDSFTPRIVAEAMDTNSDKATGKATTAAVKRLFTEVFKVVDPTEKDLEEDDPETKNRAVTTDQRNGSGDRGSQARAKAAPGGGTRQPPTRSVTTDPRPKPARQETVEEAVAATGANPDDGVIPEDPAERPEPEQAPDESRLDKAKARVRVAAKTLALDPPTINAIAAEVTGKERREEWIVLPTLVEKLAKELEERVASA